MDSRQRHFHSDPLYCIRYEFVLRCLFYAWQKIMLQKRYGPLASLILIWIVRVSYLWSVWMTFKMMDITLNDFFYWRFPNNVHVARLSLELSFKLMFGPSETQSIVNPRQSWSPAILCLAMTSWRFLRELTSRNLPISLGDFSFAPLPLAERSTASCKLSVISAFLYLRNKERSQIQTSVSSSTPSVSLLNAPECSEAPRVALRWKNTRPDFSCVTAAWTCRVTASRNVSTSVCICLVIVSSCVLVNKRLALRPFQSNPWYVAVSLNTVDALRAHGPTRSKCGVHLYRP